MNSLPTPYTPDRIDRVLLGGCAAVWLGALGAGVAATVALVDLGRGHTANTAPDSGTPWFLYAVIGVSAVVIVAAVPLLLRARRGAQQDTKAAPRASGRPVESPSPARTIDAPTEKIRAAAPDAPRRAGLRAPAPGHSPLVEQLWVRCAASVVCAMGTATLVAVSTYLMAVDTDATAWVLYGVAGIISIGTAGIPWYFLREMRAHVADQVY